MIIDKHGNPISEPPKEIKSRLDGVRNIILLTVALVAGLAAFLTNIETVGTGLGLKKPWDYYGEPEIAGEFVSVGPAALSFEDANKLLLELRNLSSLAYKLDMPQNLETNFGGTYSGSLEFAKSDVQLVRSLREQGKWEVVIDLISRGDSDIGETEQRARNKLDVIITKSHEYLRGSGPSSAEGETFYRLVEKISENYFIGSSIKKYSITDYESMYSQKLENVANKE